MTLVANRPSLRTRYRTLRQQLDSQSRAAKTIRINNHLRELVPQQARSIAAYLASPEEACVRAFIETAWQRGQAVFLPCIDKNPRMMTFRHYDRDEPLRKNRFALLEPEPHNDSAVASDLDCVLLPLVAFDDTGTRLGMGGGYYDTFFADPDSRPPLVGVGFCEQRAADPLPQAAWDVQLDAVVTDLGVVQFQQREAIWR